jgi:hypothetical protein
MRLIVLVLLLANGVYFAWSQGLMRAYGFAPVQQSEPHRMENQINPSALRLLTDQEARAMDAQLQAAKSPKTCLQAGPFDETQAAALRSALEASFPEDAWQLEAQTSPERWIVYMGKFPTPEALAKKKQELLSIHLPTQPLQNPSLELGLSLGHFDSEASANSALLEFSKRGLRTGRVVLELPETQSHQLKLGGLTEALKPKLGDIKSALAGKPLLPCDPSSR